MKHLFKLKKDGKTVGYLTFPIDPYLSVLGIWFSKEGRNWERCPQNIIDGNDFDEALPYVCDDKNGEPVFAGDKVRRVNGEPGVVKWYEFECRYILTNNNNCYDIDELELNSFELIKEDSEQ